MNQGNGQLIAGAGLTFAMAVFLTVGAGASDHTYSEDFRTQTYMDGPATTAIWNTATGELKLNSFHPTRVGSYSASYARSPVVVGDLLVMGDIDGIQILDISDPENPAPVSSYSLSGTARYDIAVSGNYAYIANLNSGIEVLDISYPPAPTPGTACATPGEPFAIAVEGDRAYVADGTSGFQVINISDPMNPTLIGGCSTSGVLAYDVAVSGNYAFVADFDGLTVIDISLPRLPAVVADCATPGNAYGVAVAGNRAYVADYGNGLVVIDITDPEAPTITGGYDTSGSAVNVTTRGNRAFVADGDSGLQILDITDPDTPTSDGTCNIYDFASGLTVSGDHAFVSGQFGIKVVQISYPTIATLVGSDGTLDDIEDFVIEGDRAYVICHPSGFHVFDISNPMAPVEIGSNSKLGYGVAVSGKYAYVANSNGGTGVFDISDPYSGVPEVGTCPTRSVGSVMAIRVAVEGDRAYVADYAGLQVIQILDPTAPVEMGGCDTPGIAQDIAVAGNLAFVADGTSGLQIIDVTTSTSPYIRATCYTPAGIYGVAVAGDFAYVVGVDGLTVIDVSLPSFPHVEGNCETPGHANEVFVVGDRAFVGDDDSGLTVVDISDPANPVLIGSCSLPGPASRVVVDGIIAFVAMGAEGLGMVQISQHEFYEADNIGQSLAIDDYDDTILRARIIAEGTSQVDWELSGDGGSNWQSMATGHYYKITNPGNDLMWRSIHTVIEPSTNPMVSQLDISWMIERGIIDSIVDVPDDEGGWVQVEFTRSALDFVGETELPISNYGIWRLEKNKSIEAAVGTLASRMPDGDWVNEKRCPSGIPTVTFEGQKYVFSRPGEATESFPEGTWVLVGTVPAVQQNQYAALVPTVADSGTTANYSETFILTTHTTTPSTWYIGESVNGYSKDNIPPGATSGISAAYSASGVFLSWDPAPESDFKQFQVYRSTNPEFIPSPTTLVQVSTSRSWMDSTAPPWGLYYKISAVDFAGNESEAAAPTGVSGVRESEIPAKTALLGAFPNPFNPQTTIAFEIRRQDDVTLRVFDLSGRLVRVLIGGESYTPGHHETVWNGRDDAGRQVASGTYFYRLEAGDFAETKRMVLVK